MRNIVSRLENQIHTNYIKYTNTHVPASICIMLHMWMQLYHAANYGSIPYTYYIVAFTAGTVVP